MNTENAATFTDQAGSHTFEIRKGPLNCNSSFVVHLIQYEVCKNQTFGNAEAVSRYRFSTYKFKVKKHRVMYIDGVL